MKEVFSNLSLLFVFIFLVFISCSEDDSGTVPQEVAPTTLIPLKVNNVWTTVFTSLISGGFVDTVITKIYSFGFVSGRTLYRTSKTDSTVGFLQDGNWFLSGRFSEYQEKEEILLKFMYPEVNVGDEWEHDGSIYLLNDKDVSITTKAGTFKCYHYLKSKSGETSFSFYIQPSVGIIRYELINQMEVAAIQNLISYSVH